MRRLGGALVLAGLVGAFLITTAETAGAAEARGCSGNGRSIGVNSNLLDRASAPGAGATEDDPFLVETKGRIAYDYQVNQGALSGGRWTATIDIGPLGSIFGHPKFSGRIDPGSSQSGDGVEPMEDHLRVGGLAVLKGAFKITINARAGGVSCTVVGWLEIKESVVQSVMFIEAVILLIIAIFLFYLAMMGGTGPEADLQTAFEGSDAAEKIIKKEIQ